MFLHAVLLCCLLLVPNLTLSAFTNVSWARDDDNHPCRRQCISGEPGKLCEYNFEIEWFTTMGRACGNCPVAIEDCANAECIVGSGTQRPVVVANRRMPGPSIEVCFGDRIRVNVMNMMQNGETVTLHWHGLHLWNDPYMDGVPMVTQCPIPPHTSFTYEFDADTAGTHMWHSHSGVQRADGLAGSLIVRSSDDPNAALYDLDNLQPMIFNDWSSTETTIARMATHHYGDTDNVPPQILVNGRWQQSRSTSFEFKGSDPAPFPVPVRSAKYRINAQLRYRFRAIANAMWRCHLRITIEGHNLVVIASDGQPIKPQATRALVMSHGERYDFIPYFTGEQTNNDGIYWLHAAAIGNKCEDTSDGLARLIYLNAEVPKVRTVFEATGRKGSTLVNEVNSLNIQTRWNEDGTTSNKDDTKLNVLMFDNIKDTPEIAGRPNASYVFRLDFSPMDDDVRLSPSLNAVRGSTQFTPRINRITMMMPPAPLLSQPGDIPDSLFCNASRRVCPAESYCKCIHVVHIPEDVLIEMAIVDTANHASVNHPMHLHGFTFHVVAMDTLHTNLSVTEVLKADKEGKIRRKLRFAPAKDTVAVPAGGYVIIRFIADNPGLWMFHCHTDFHMDLGMGLVVKVGSGSPPLPSKDFPRCGNYKPPSRFTAPTAAGAEN